MPKELVKVCTVKVDKASREEAGQIFTVDLSTLHTQGATKAIDVVVHANGLAVRDDFYVALARAASAFYVRAWDKERPLCKFFGHERLLCLQQVGTEFTVAGSSTGNLLLWETTSGDLVQVLSAHFQGVLKICALPGDDPLFVSCGLDGLVKVWDLWQLLLQGDNVPVPLHILSHKSIADVHLSFSGRLLVAEDCCVCLYDDAYAGEANLLAIFDLPSAVHLVLLNALEDLILAVGQSDIYLVDLHPSSHGSCPANTIRTGLGKICSAVFSADDERLIVGGEDGTLQLWDVQTRVLLMQNTKLTDQAVTGLYLHPLGACEPSPNLKLTPFKRQLSKYQPAVQKCPPSENIATEDTQKRQLLLEEVERLRRVNAALLSRVVSNLENK
jgi:WD40 repeat protein